MIKVWPAILTAILWGACYASTERVIEHINIKSYLLFSCIFSTIFFLWWGLSDGTLIPDIERKGNGVIGWVLLSSILALIGSYFSVYAVKSCGASTASLIECSYPLTTILFCLLFSWKFDLSLTTIIGGLGILLGTIIVIKGQ